MNLQTVLCLSFSLVFLEVDVNWLFVIIKSYVKVNFKKRNNKSDLEAVPNRVQQFAYVDMPVNVCTPKFKAHTRDCFHAYVVTYNSLKPRCHLCSLKLTASDYYDKIKPNA